MYFAQNLSPEEIQQGHHPLRILQWRPVITGNGPADSVQAPTATEAVPDCTSGGTPRRVLNVRVAIASSG